MTIGQQAGDQWGGWTQQDMVREHFSGNHCTPLLLNLRQHGDLYVRESGVPPSVKWNEEEKKYEIDEDSRTTPAIWRFYISGDDYAFDLVDSIPDGARTFDYVRGS